MECERSLPISTRKERGLKLSKVLGLLNQTHKFLSRFWIVGKYPTHGTSTAPTRFWQLRKEWETGKKSRHSMPKKYIVNLTAQEREDLHQLTSQGSLSARKLKRAQILLLADEGHSGCHHCPNAACGGINRTSDATKMCGTGSGIGSLRTPSPRRSTQARRKRGSFPCGYRL